MLDFYLQARGISTLHHNCVYSTRIIVYLLKATVPFQYVWLDEMFKETATYIFYALTAYKFRPVPSHPYFAVDSDDEADEEVEV